MVLAKPSDLLCVVVQVLEAAANSRPWGAGIASFQRDPERSLHPYDANLTAVVGDAGTRAVERPPARATSLTIEHTSTLECPRRFEETDFQGG